MAHEPDPAPRGLQAGPPVLWPLPPSLPPPRLLQQCGSQSSLNGTLPFGPSGQASATGVGVGVGGGRAWMSVSFLFYKAENG